MSPGPGTLTTVAYLLAFRSRPLDAAALLSAVAWKVSHLFANSDAGSLVIALIASALLLFKLAQRSKTTPDELDRTTATPQDTVAPLSKTAPANA